MPKAAEEIAPGERESAGEAAPQAAKGSGPFGGLSPSEAAKRSHQARKQREAEDDIAERATGEILVPVDDERIYKALRRKAEGGDVQAARLILERPRAARQDVLALLSKDERAQVRAWLEAHRDKAPA